MVRSRTVRRGRTGRKASGKHRVRRRTTVHKHHPRRYAGVRGGTKRRVSARKKRATSTVKRKRARTRHLTTRHRAKRKSVRRKTSRPSVRRHVTRRKGLRHPHKGVHKPHHVTHRRKSAHPAHRARKRAYTPPAPINASSYLSMF